MGTSQSNPGLGKKSPLVPPWADSPSDRPVNLTDFKHAMRGVAQGGGSESGRRALGHYARDVTGGEGFARKRFGNAIQGGVDLFNILSQSDEILFDLKSLEGKPCEEVVALLAGVLTKSNGDADIINAATAQALSNALQSNISFSVDMVTMDLILVTIVNYYTEVITNRMIQDSGDSWDKASTPSRVIEAENQLRQLVYVVVDKHFMPILQKNHNMTLSSDVKKIQETVIQEVWNEWGSYE